MDLKAHENANFVTLLAVLKQVAPAVAGKIDLRPTPENYRRLLLTMTALAEDGDLPDDVLDRLDPITAETRGFLRASRRVCLIERKDGSESTGVMVGPDIVLTAAHTMLGTEGIFADPSQVTVRVDRFLVRPRRAARRTSSRLLTARGSTPPQPVVLASSIKVMPDGSVEDYEMDYIFFKIAEPLGKDFLGWGKHRQQRGWMGISFIAHPTTAGSSVTVLQHPLGRVQHYARGAVRKLDGFRIHYEVDALNGSSGAPIVDEAVRLVGIHTGQVSDAERLGIDIGAIVADVRRRFPDTADEALQGFPPTEGENRAA